MMLSSKLYSKMAYHTQNLFFTVKGYAVKRIKFSNQFYQELEELEKTQWYSKDEYEEYQYRKLKQLIQHAYENVPYYEKLFNEHNIKPADIKSTNDLEKIPILTKETLRAQPQEFIARNINKKFLAPGWTTGTTGTPINAYRDKKSIVFENAMIWRQRRIAGINENSRKVAIWGTIWDNLIVHSSIKHPPYWRYNRSDNQLLFSYFHMSNETLPLYLEKLEEFNPDFMEAFPSTLLILAKYLLATGKVLPVKAIFTSSEPLYAIHKQEIERALHQKYLICMVRQKE